MTQEILKEQLTEAYQIHSKTIAMIEALTSMETPSEPATTAKNAANYLASVAQSERACEKQSKGPVAAEKEAAKRAQDSAKRAKDAAKQAIQSTKDDEAKLKAAHAAAHYIDRVRFAISAFSESLNSIMATNDALFTHSNSANREIQNASSAQSNAYLKTSRASLALAEFYANTHDQSAAAAAALENKKIAVQEARAQAEIAKANAVAAIEIANAAAELARVNAAAEIASTQARHRALKRSAALAVTVMASSCLAFATGELKPLIAIVPIALYYHYNTEQRSRSETQEDHHQPAP